MRSRILASRIFTSSLRPSALRSRHQRSDVRDELAREIDLRPAPERMLAAVVEEGERAVVRAERLVREIGGEQRNAFARALVLRVRAQVLALRGKADAERRVLAPGDPREDIRILDEVEGHAPAAVFLDLL